MKQKNKRDLDYVINQILKFRDDRDWLQFHDPKNLSQAISIETAELQEIFLWATTEESKKLSADKIKVILGDATDQEVLELLNLGKAKMLICTASTLSENLSILEHIKNLKSPRPSFIGNAQTKDDAIKLYEKGADFVMVPEVLAGEFLRHVFLSHGVALKRFKRMGKSHFNRLLYAKI